MIKYILYLDYLIRHKWYVFLECKKRGLFWAGVFHDWSKFRLSEMIPYANFFYGKNRQELQGQYAGTSDEAFNLAWLKHIHRNPHHWQYWILVQDDDHDVFLQMPRRYRIEMLCDWIGAGRASHNPNSVTEWYLQHENKIKLHDVTRALIEMDLGIPCHRYYIELRKRGVIK